MTCIKCTSTTDCHPQIREPPKEQFLFLLEIYVRCIQSSRLAKLNEMFYVPTTVGFQFLHFKADDELQLTPVNTQFQPAMGIADDVEYFYSGRSVLFALGQNAMSSICSEFKINLCVFKRMPADIKPDVLVGKAEVDMTMHFAALRKEMIDRENYPECADPNPSKVFDEDIPLCFEHCQCGTLGIFARISAYGQTIVNEFSTREDIAKAASFIFRADDVECNDKPLSYKCRILEPDACTLTSIQSEDGQKDCFVCKPPKFACMPCRIASGAIAARDPCRKKSETHCVLESCAPGIQTSRGPKEPCGKAVVLKVSGLLDASACGKPQQPCVTVLPESEATDPANMCDPEHDVFILRIGKKGLVGAGEKSDIQLEMRTPKGPERRPPVRLETREMQTDDGKGGKKAGKAKKKK